MPQDVQQYLLQVAKFSPAEMAALENGTVITKVEPGGVDTEILTVAAVKIRATADQVVSYYGQMISYVDGAITKAFGKFSNPPTAADVKDLSLDPEDVAQLRSCKRGNCDIRVGGAGLDTFRSSVNWNAPDAASQVNVLARQAVLGYVSAYVKSGDAALVTYNDRSEPVSLKQQWQSILAGSPYFQQYSPALREYLEQYPRKTLQGATDVLYWVKEDYTGLKPVISVVHGVIYAAPERPGRIVVVQKQLYASHYYDGSLAVANVVGTSEGSGIGDLSALRQPLARRSPEGRVRRSQAQGRPRSGEEERRADARNHQERARARGLRRQVILSGRDTRVARIPPRGS